MRSLQHSSQNCSRYISTYIPELSIKSSRLLQAKVEQEALLESLERERDGYQERLVAAKRTMEAQETELQAKEARFD